MLVVVAASLLGSEHQHSRLLMLTLAWCRLAPARTPPARGSPAQSQAAPRTENTQNTENTGEIRTLSSKEDQCSHFSPHIRH